MRPLLPHFHYLAPYLEDGPATAHVSYGFQRRGLCGFALTGQFGWGHTDSRPTDIPVCRRCLRLSDSD